MNFPLLTYTSDCDYQKGIGDRDWIVATTALPASYAAETVCKALNSELPGAMDAAGIKASQAARDGSEVRPPADHGRRCCGDRCKICAALDEHNGFGGEQQYGPSARIKVRPHDVVSGEYCGRAHDSYPISIRLAQSK